MSINKALLLKMIFFAFFIVSGMESRAQQWKQLDKCVCDCKTKTSCFNCFKRCCVNQCMAGNCTPGSKIKNCATNCDSYKTPDYMKFISCC